MKIWQRIRKFFGLSYHVNDVVTLPLATAGKTVEIYNAGNQPLTVSAPIGFDPENWEYIYAEIDTVAKNATKIYTMEEK